MFSQKQKIQNGLLLGLVLSVCALNAQISVSIQVNQNITCFGGNNGSLTATVTPAGVPYTFTWSNGGNAATISGLVADIYMVTVQGPSGGTATATAVLSEPAELVLTAITELPLAVYPTGTVEVETTGGITPYVFQWINSAGIPVSNQEDLVDAPADVYTQTATDANGCTAELFPVELVSTSSTKDISGIDLQVFPNPVTNILTIEFSEEGNRQMQIFNARGQLIETRLLQSPRNSIPVESWPSGCYNLVFPGLGKTVKVVKI